MCKFSYFKVKNLGFYWAKNASQKTGFGTWSLNYPGEGGKREKRDNLKEFTGTIGKKVGKGEAWLAECSSDKEMATPLEWLGLA